MVWKKYASHTVAHRAAQLQSDLWTEQTYIFVCSAHEEGCLGGAGLLNSWKPACTQPVQHETKHDSHNAGPTIGLASNYYYWLTDLQRPLDDNTLQVRLMQAQQLGML